MRFTFAWFASAVVLGALGTASASTITVVDGNMDTAGASTTPNWSHIDTTSWTPANDSGFALNNGDNITPQAGPWALFLSNETSISQSLAATVHAGDQLSISFYEGRANSSSTVNAPGVGTVDLTVGSTHYTQTFDSSALALNSWQQVTFTTTVANTGPLSLSFISTSGNVWLDTISNVTVVPAPEPASVALMGLAAAGLGLVALKRRRVRGHGTLPQSP